MVHSFLRPRHHPIWRGLTTALALGLAALGSAQAYGPEPAARHHTPPGHAAHGRWAPAPAMAEFDARQAWQQQRIAQGMARGDLTRREAKRLQQQQRAIAQAAQLAWRDGMLTAQERHHLTQLQWQAGQHIRLALRDDDGGRGNYHPVRGYR
jgi:hypothetical protein